MHEQFLSDCFNGVLDERIIIKIVVVGASLELLFCFIFLFLLAHVVILTFFDCEQAEVGSGYIIGVSKARWLEEWKTIPYTLM